MAKDKRPMTNETTESEPKDDGTAADGTGPEAAAPKRPAAKPARAAGAKPKQASRASSLRSRLALGAGERTPKQARPGASPNARSVLLVASLLVNVIALSVIGWFLYAKSLPGNNGSVVGLKLAEAGAQSRTKEEATARQYVNRMMNFDWHNLDAFSAAMSTNITGDLKKTTGPEQLNAIKQLFTTLEASSTFQVISSTVVEDRPEQAVVAVAGHQTLSLKGDKGSRSMSTIIKVTVNKKDQSIAALESLDDFPKGGKDPGPPPLFPMPQNGQGSQQGQAPQAGQAPGAGTPKQGQ